MTDVSEPADRAEQIPDGRFIVICGIDGAGKSTQEGLLAERLRRAGRRVHCTKNPTDWYRKDVVVYDFIRHGQRSVRMETLALIAAADRMRQLDTEILPLIAEGIDVICNRYVYSTFGYFKARGADMAFVEAANQLVHPPDRAVLLTIDPAVAVCRIRQRQREIKFEERHSDYLRDVQDAILDRWPGRFLCLSGERPRDVIADAIYQYVTT